MGLKSTGYSKKKVRRCRGRRKTAKGGSRALDSRFNSDKAKNAEIKGMEAALNATQAGNVADIQAALARDAAIKAVNMSNAVDQGRQDIEVGRIGHRDKQEYKGEVKNNKRNGCGVYKYGETSVYKGEFKDNKRHGVGVITTPEYTYEGDWNNDNMDGYGTYVFSCRDVYNGSHKNDQFDGYGVYTQVNTGATFKGEYKADKKNGYGTYEDETKLHTHSGLYVNDRFVLGRGRLILQDGIYTGDLKNDTGTGNGKFRYDTGDVYEGRFKKYKKYGPGKLTRHDGTVQEGWWEGDTMKGTITYPTGRFEEGYFVLRPPLRQNQADTYSDASTDEADEMLHFM